MAESGGYFLPGDGDTCSNWTANKSSNVESNHLQSFAFVYFPRFDAFRYLSHGADDDTLRKWQRLLIAYRVVMQVAAASGGGLVMTIDTHTVGHQCVNDYI